MKLWPKTVDGLDIYTHSGLYNAGNIVYTLLFKSHFSFKLIVPVVLPKFVLLINDMVLAMRGYFYTHTGLDYVGNILNTLLFKSNFSFKIIFPGFSKICLVDAWNCLDRHFDREKIEWIIKTKFDFKPGMVLTFLHTLVLIM